MPASNNIYIVNGEASLTAAAPGWYDPAERTPDQDEEDRWRLAEDGRELVGPVK